MNRANLFNYLRRRDSGVFGTSLSQGQVSGIEAILDAGGSYPLAHLAYALATAYGETGRKMQPVEENLNYSAKRIPQVFSAKRLQGRSPASLAGNPELLANTVYGGDWGRRNLGNTREGDGWRYRGRGLPQVTGRANYAKIGRLVRKDLEGNPDLMLSPAVAAQSLLVAMRDGIYTGSKFADYLPGSGPATRDQFRKARHIINGQFAADDYAGYAVAFQTALSGAGYTSKASHEPPVRPDVEPTPPAAKPAKPALPGWLAAFFKAIFGKR